MPNKQQPAVTFRTRFVWWASVATGFALSFWTSSIWGRTVLTTIWYYAGGPLDKHSYPDFGAIPYIIFLLLPVFLSSIVVTWPLLLRTRRFDVFVWNSILAWLPMLAFWYKPMQRILEGGPVATIGTAGYWLAALYLYLICGHLEHRRKKLSSGWRIYSEGVVVGIALSVLVIVGEGLAWGFAIVTSSFEVARVMPVVVSAALLLVYWYRRWLSSSKPAR